MSPTNSARVGKTRGHAGVEMRLSRAAYLRRQVRLASLQQMCTIWLCPHAKQRQSSQSSSHLRVQYRFPGAVERHGQEFEPHLPVQHILPMEIESAGWQSNRAQVAKAR